MRFIHACFVHIRNAANISASGIGHTLESGREQQQKMERVMRFELTTFTLAR